VNESVVDEGMMIAKRLFAHDIVLIWLGNKVREKIKNQFD
jgi:hypothetical protein